MRNHFPLDMLLAGTDRENECYWSIIGPIPLQYVRSGILCSLSTSFHVGRSFKMYTNPEVTYNVSTLGHLVGLPSLME